MTGFIRFSSEHRTLEALGSPCWDPFLVLIRVTECSFLFKDILAVECYQPERAMEAKCE